MKIRSSWGKVVLCALVLAALVGAGAAYTAASPGAKLQKQDRVYGGGQFGPGCFSNSSFCQARPRNFAIDGHAEGNGSEAVGNSTYGTPTFAQSFRDITCLRIDGNRAAIGGIIESGDDAGFLYLQYFVDRGGPGLGDRDLGSPAFIDPPDSSNWPTGFPYTCPSPTSGLPAAPPIFQEVHSGDIVVQDAPNS